MLNILYPLRERQLFVDRLEILAQLEAAAGRLIRGPGTCACANWQAGESIYLCEALTATALRRPTSQR